MLHRARAKWRWFLRITLYLSFTCTLQVNENRPKVSDWKCSFKHDHCSKLAFISGKDVPTDSRSYGGRKRGRGVKAPLGRLCASRSPEVTFFCRSSIGRQLILNSVKWLEGREGWRSQSFPTDASLLCVGFEAVSGGSCREERRPTEGMNSLKSSPTATVETLRQKPKKWSEQKARGTFDVLWCFF